MVWAVRRREEAGVILEKGEGPELFVTRGNGREAQRTRPPLMKERAAQLEEGGVELEEQTGLLNGAENSEEVANKEGDITDIGRVDDEPFVFKRGRPDLRRIVDEVFAGGEEGKVAVLVCGPVGMGRVVRREVGKWVRRGREVFWHKEEYGW